jgi:hypothetical protein
LEGKFGMRKMICTLSGTILLATIFGLSFSSAVAQARANAPSGSVSGSVPGSVSGSSSIRSTGVERTTASVSSGSAAQAKNSDLDEDGAQALQQTQQLLKDQAARDKSLKDPEAVKADSEVKNLMGADTQAMYELTADILPTIVKEGHGDPAQIQVIMNQLLKNPESLASKLTPEQLSRLKAMAKRVESRQPTAAPTH